MILEPLIAAIALASFVTQVILNLPEDGSVANSVWQMLRYFTVLTNLTVAAILLRATLRGRMPGPAISAAMTTWIIVVGSVYHGLLYQGHDPATLDFWVDHGFHTAVPLLTVLWWGLRADKSGLRWAMPLVWALFPIAYLVYALARGLADGVFPYFFIDPTIVGWGGVAAWVTGLFALFCALGVGLIGLSRLRARRRAA